MVDKCRGKLTVCESDYAACTQALSLGTAVNVNGSCDDSRGLFSYCRYVFDCSGNPDYAFLGRDKKGTLLFLPEITVAIQEHMFYNINY